jgi:hypothetical protein
MNSYAKKGRRFWKILVERKRERHGKRERRERSSQLQTLERERENIMKIFGPKNI